MASKIREGSLSSVEVVEAHLSQIYKFNQKINAVITVDAEGALKRAKEADNALKKGYYGTFTWCPIYRKGSFSNQIHPYYQWFWSSEGCHTRL